MTERHWLDKVLPLAAFAFAFVLWKISKSPDLLFMALALASGILYVAYAMMRRRPQHHFAEAGAYKTYRQPVALWRDFFVIFFVVFVFRGFFYNWFSIPSNSMQPTLTVGDFVLVDRRQYGFRAPVFNWRLSAGENPRRGDVIVFHHPHDGIIYIKRVMAIPGDSIALHSNGAVAINGAELNSRSAGAYRYAGLSHEAEKVAAQMPDGGWHFIMRDAAARDGVARAPDAGYCSLRDGGLRLHCVVPTDRYFVLGDNRNHSNDSRFWGFVQREHIIGPALNVLLNFGDWSRAGNSLLLHPREEWNAAADPEFNFNSEIEIDHDSRTDSEQDLAAESE